MTTSNDWTPWGGLPFMPVPESAVGDVKLRGGRVMLNVRARDLLWGRAAREVSANDATNPGEIVAYRFEGEAA